MKYKQVIKSHRLTLEYKTLIHYILKKMLIIYISTQNDLTNLLYYKFLEKPKSGLNSVSYAFCMYTSEQGCKILTSCKPHIFNTYVKTYGNSKHETTLFLCNIYSK